VWLRYRCASFWPCLHICFHETSCKFLVEYWMIFLRLWYLASKSTSSLPFTTQYICIIQSDSFSTRPKKMRISQRLFIRFWTCIYDYIPCFMRSMSILEEILEMFATTVQAELNAMLHVCESGLQDVLTNHSNFTSNVVFVPLYGAWLVGISFSF